VSSPATGEGERRLDDSAILPSRFALGSPPLECDPDEFAGYDSADNPCAACMTFLHSSCWLRTHPLRRCRTVSSKGPL